MYKGALKAYRNKAYLNCDTGEITKRNSLAMKWAEDGCDVDEVVGTRTYEDYIDDEYSRHFFEYDSFRTVKA